MARDDGRRYGSLTIHLELIVTLSAEAPPADLDNRSLNVTPEPLPQSMFSSLGSRNFRIFVGGQVASQIGGWTQRVAQDWLVLTLTGSAAAVGVTTALQFLPTLLFGMVGGLAADRFPKRRIMMCTQSVLGLCALTMTMLCLTHSVALWQIFTLAFIGGTAAAFDNPTRQSFVHEMVGPGQLRNGVSINSAVFNLGALIGPAVSATLITLLGIGWSFAVNAASFGVVLLALAAIRTGDLHLAPALPPGRRQMRTALSEIGGRPELVWPIALAGICALFTSNFAVSLTAYAKHFHMGAAGYGFLTSALAVGSLSGALLTARRSASRLRNLIELAGALALAQLLAAIAPGTVTLAIALVVLGACTPPFGITANATVQLAAGHRMRGRVMGVYMLVVMGAAAVGGPLVGTLDEAFGAGTGLFVGALVVGTAAIAIGLQLARATNTPVQPVLRSGVDRVRGWLPAGSR
jgi:MFS family permease